jgi:hypothetical protein
MEEEYEENMDKDKLEDKIVEYGLQLISIGKDIEYIKKKIENGINETLDLVNKTLGTLADNDIKINNQMMLKEAEFNEKINDVSNRITIMDSNNWFSKLMTIGVKKALLYVLTAMLVFAGFNTCMWMVAKSYHFQETPGQAKNVAESMKVVLDSSYHRHNLPDGKIIIHANDYTKPAWLLNDNNGTYIPAPLYRTDDGLSGVHK